MTFGKFGILAIAALLASPAWAGEFPTSGSVKAANSVVHWGQNQLIATGISGVNVGGTMGLTCANAAGCGVLIQGVVVMSGASASDDFTCVAVDGGSVPPLCVNTLGAGSEESTAVPVIGVTSVTKGVHKITVKAGGGTINSYNISAQILQ